MAASLVPLLYLGNQKLRVGMGEITCSSGLLQTFRFNWVLVLGYAEWMPLPPQDSPPPRYPAIRSFTHRAHGKPLWDRPVFHLEKE